MKVGHHSLPFRMACVASLVTVTSMATAATLNTSFEVRLVVRSSCSIAAYPLNIRCTPGTAYIAGLKHRPVEYSLQRDPVRSVDTVIATVDF